jgi:hypothetical protein
MHINQSINAEQGFTTNAVTFLGLFRYEKFQNLKYLERSSELVEPRD